MTPQATTYPSKVVAWDDVLTALRGGQFIQTRGAMCVATEAGDAYCPLGVIAYLGGAKFELHGTDDVLCDDNGETDLPDADILHALGLDGYMTDVDYERIPEYAAAMQYFYGGEDILRYDALAFMSDQLGLRFHKIADEIERLGWNE